MSVDSASPRSILDLEGTLARFGGDQELFAEMTGMLVEDLPRLFAKLGAAVDAGDAAAVRMHAHALNGLVAGCGGVRAAEAAQLLENAGHANDLSNSQQFLKTLNSELDLLKRALSAYQA